MESRHVKYHEADPFRVQAAPPQSYHREFPKTVIPVTTAHAPGARRGQPRCRVEVSMQVPSQPRTTDRGRLASSAAAAD